MAKAREKIINVSSIEETEAIGRELGSSLEPGSCIALIGSLGTGKTELTRWICAGAGGFDPYDAASPTFVFHNQYSTERGIVNHWDFYRLEDTLSLESIGYYDYVSGGHINIIEWADKFPDELPERRIEVSINFIDENIRQFKIAYLE